MTLKHLLPVPILAIVAGCEESARVPSLLADPASVRSITLESRSDRNPDAEPRVVVIEDPTSIKDLLSLAVFKKKPACACAHFESLTFRGVRGEAKAYICDHCFDLFEGDSCTNFEMTEEFRRKYRELLGQPDNLDRR